MSNMVRKGDFLVFVNSDSGRVTEFFVSTSSFNLDDSRRGISHTRRLVDGCFGFRLKDNYYYHYGTSYYWTERLHWKNVRSSFNG